MKFVMSEESLAYFAKPVPLRWVEIIQADSLKPDFPPRGISLRRWYPEELLAVNFTCAAPEGQHQCIASSGGRYKSKREVRNVVPAYGARNASHRAGSGSIKQARKKRARVLDGIRPMGGASVEGKRREGEWRQSPKYDATFSFI